MEEPSADTVEKEFLSIQSIIKDFLVEKSNQHPIQDRWSYERGTGGGLSIVWEGKEGSLLEKGITCIFHAGVAGFFPPLSYPFYPFTHSLDYCATIPTRILLKIRCDCRAGGVNFSGISGVDLPSAAVTQLSIPAGTPYRATGVSLVIHPFNPHIPTIRILRLRCACCNSLLS